jgi:hypothetical protein
MDRVIDVVFGEDAPRWVRGAASVGGIRGLVRGGGKIASGVAIPAIAGRGLRSFGKGLEDLATDPRAAARFRRRMAPRLERIRQMPPRLQAAALFLLQAAGERTGEE